MESSGSQSHNNGTEWCPELTPFLQISSLPNLSLITIYYYPTPNPSPSNHVLNSSVGIEDTAMNETDHKVPTVIEFPVLWMKQ